MTYASIGNISPSHLIYKIKEPENPYGHKSQSKCRHRHTGTDTDCLKSGLLKKQKKKHNKSAMLGWYRYDIGMRFAARNVRIIRFCLLSHLVKLYHYDRIDVGVTKTGSGSPFVKISTF